MLLAILVGPAAAYIGVMEAMGNIHVVTHRVLYRSGQLGAVELGELVHAEGIRSILNLRGDHPEEEWWRTEVRLAHEAGLSYGSVALSSGSQPDMQTMMRLADLMRNAPKPLLIHCTHGADRSGLAAAIYRLTAEGASEEDASEQLSIAYGHFPWLGSRTRAMDDAFAAFAAQWQSAAAQEVPEVQEAALR